MITSLTKLQKNLGFKLDTEEYEFCLAIDTATKSGFALLSFNKNKVFIKTFALALPKLSKEIEDKAEKYEEHLAQFVELIDKELISQLKYKKITEKSIKLLVLENSFLKMNVVTFGFLRALQGILYAKLKPEFDEVKIIFPITARKLVGFKSTLPKGSTSKNKKKEIVKWISNIVEEQIIDDNIADALLLAFAGLKKKN
jgi:Holliday junction resolvasome RuvABC endonuclease subunit